MSTAATTPAPPPVLLDEAEIARARDAVAAELAARGAVARERVGVLGGTRPEMVAARDAAVMCELTVIPLHPQLAAPELAHVIDHARPRALVVEPGRGAAVAEAIARHARHQPAVIEVPPVAGAARSPGAAADLPAGATLIYTSGTTGRPKGCVRTAGQEAARAAELVRTYGIGPDDVHLIACPLAYSAPGILLRAARRAGAATALLPRFMADGFLAAVAACRATFFFLVPTQYQRLLELPVEQRRASDLSSVRAALVAGAPMPPALRRALVDWLGPGRLWEFYGSSETGTVSVLAPDEQLVHPDTVGRPVPGVELRLESAPGADGGTVGTVGTVGEIFVRSPTVMSGYWDPASQSAAWPGTADGFLSVGDLGEQAHAGAPLRLIDRIHDTIITGGVNVYPAEVERALHEHPDVAGAVVFGVADPRWQQRVAALVVRAPGSAVSADDLRAFLRDRLAPHKLPRQIAFVAADELPRSASGKPLRRAAAALL
ncbi:MAG TPA: class I adenylate-forming enzyme family protein [Kofleriaceae bacterium]|nr:class I adenylate-forming enzyme family protein [Kofleriaceae bacterium]